jgi:hypothetical protein
MTDIHRGRQEDRGSAPLARWHLKGRVLARLFHFSRCFTCKTPQKVRADERTRTADLPSLRVCGQRLLSVAQACKSRISKRFVVPCIAHYCRELRAG